MPDGGVGIARRQLRPGSLPLHASHPLTPGADAPSPVAGRPWRRLTFLTCPLASGEIMPPRIGFFRPSELLGGLIKRKLFASFFF